VIQASTGTATVGYRRKRPTILPAGSPLTRKTIAGRRMWTTARIPSTTFTANQYQGKTAGPMSEGPCR
jgi:hypothetical protein